MIVFRCDSSQSIGTGHIYRCLSLAEKFKSCGVSSVFICADSDLPGSSLLRDSRYPVETVQFTDNEESDAKDCSEVLKKYPQATHIVVDNYRLGRKWESIFYQRYKIFVIDDLIREHQSHFLLDNGHLSEKNSYKDKCPSDCTFFLGPKYSLLREEFLQAKVNSNSKAEFHRVIVFFGGADQSGESLRFLEETSAYSGPLKFSVVVTKSNAHLQKLQSLKLNPSFEILIQPKMSRELLNHDLYLGSGGVITWERMYLGVPGFVVSVAENQEAAAKELAELGEQFYLGSKEEVNYQEKLSDIENACKDKTQLNQMRAKNLKLVSDFSQSELKKIL